MKTRKPEHKLWLPDDWSAIKLKMIIHIGLVTFITKQNAGCQQQI
jgi:hypothetical protein